jgi:sugar diacid utilization regulator
VWDAVLDASEQGGEAAEQALAAARTVIRHIDLATTEASAAYLEAQQLLLADGDRVRRDLLEDLLTGRRPATAAGLAAARAAGLEGDARCVLVAALPTVAPEDEGALRLAANGLAAAIGRGGSPLAVVRHGEIVVVRALAGGGRVSLLAPLQKACKRLASRGVVLAVGVSTVQDGVTALGEAYREASQALGRVARDGGVLSLPDMSAFEYLMLRDDDVARRLIAPEIERFVGEDREQGGLLTRTLLAYAEADLNAKAAAEALLIHVNTAHYRLARIAEKTGCDLRRLSDVIDLLVAIRLTEDRRGR